MKVKFYFKPGKIRNVKVSLGKGRGSSTDDRFRSVKRIVNYITGLNRWQGWKEYIYVRTTKGLIMEITEEVTCYHLRLGLSCDIF